MQDMIHRHGEIRLVTLDVNACDCLTRSSKENLLGHHVRAHLKMSPTFQKFGRTASDGRLLFPAFLRNFCLTKQSQTTFQVSHPAEK